MAYFDFLTGSNKADGDSNGNLFVRLKDKYGNGIGKQHRELLPSNQEALILACKNDNVAIMIHGDRKGNIIIGNYNPELIENFEGGTLNVQKWTQVATTFVPVQATTTGYNHNSTSLTTANAVNILQSQRVCYKYPRVPLQIKRRFRHALVANSFHDFGWGIPVTTTLLVPTGICFRISTSGIIQGVISCNSFEIVTAIPSTVSTNGNTIGLALTMSNSYYTSNYFVWDIIIDDDNAVFTIQDTSTGEFIGVLTMPVPIANYKMWSATALPYYERVYNSASVPTTAPIIITSELQILNTDININMDASQTASNLGLTISRNPFTGASLSVRANSTVPGTATLSNTTASYTTPDGGFVFAAVAGAETDYLLVAFQVPTGLKFIFEGVCIETYNQVVAVATTPTVFEWQVGHNQSAASLATANILRQLIGVQTFLLGALAGQKADKIDYSVNGAGEITESGRFVTLSLRIPTSTATATQTFRGIYHIKGRFI